MRAFSSIPSFFVKIGFLQKYVEKNNIFSSGNTNSFKCDKNRTKHECEDFALLMKDLNKK